MWGRCAKTSRPTVGCKRPRQSSGYQVAQQTCKTCNKSQPESNYQKNRWGRVKVCKSCRKPRAKKVKAEASDEVPLPKVDRNSAGYTETADSIGGGGTLFDEKNYRTEMKGVGKVHTNQLTSRKWVARQCTYYPGMKPKPQYTPEELKKLNPFDESYDSFWAEGVGRTEQAAIRAVREDIKLMRKGEA